MKLKTPKFPSRGHHTTGPSTTVSSAPFAAPASGTPTPPASPAQAATALAAPLKKRATTALAAPTRQRNAAVMIAGAALIIVAGAIGANVAASFDDSLEVLVAAESLVEGQPIGYNDFRVVKIAAAAGDIEAMSPDSIEDLVGQIAAGPIGEGSMIHPDQFTQDTEAIRVVVGAALGPNQYPVGGLKPGDQVRLIEIGSVFDDDGGFATGREISMGEIIDAVPLTSGNEMHFAIRVPESVAGVVADRVANDRLTLALLDQSITLDKIDPLDPAAPVVPLELPEEDAG